MTEHKHKPDVQQAEMPEPETAASTAAEAAETVRAEAETDPTAALRAEIADLRDRLMRSIAEAENLRKRAEREVRDAGQYAISKFAGDILSVGDNMRRALDTVGSEARAAADAAFVALLDGVELTERELLNALDRHGVKRIDPHGARFDPNLHQAMFEVPDDSVPAGTVVQVVQPGYTIGERCLRPAMVGVSRGGPKPAPRQDAEPAATGEAAGPKVDRTA